MKKLILAILFLACPVLADAEGVVAVRAIKGGFADVRDRVQFAVESQGLVVDRISEVGAMLERTGRDLGTTRKVYGDAVVLEFCSALISRQMVEADASLLAYCPYGIAVYTLPSEPMTTYVAFRRVSSGANGAQKQALEKVDALMSRIVEEAVF